MYAPRYSLRLSISMPNTFSACARVSPRAPFIVIASAQMTDNGEMSVLPSSFKLCLNSLSANSATAGVYALLSASALFTPGVICASSIKFFALPPEGSTLTEQAQSDAATDASISTHNKHETILFAMMVSPCFFNKDDSGRERFQKR